MLKNIDCSMHHCLKVLAFRQTSPGMVQKGALPSSKTGEKPGLSLLAAKMPLKTTFSSSVFALFDKEGCHHSKDFLE